MQSRDLTERGPTAHGPITVPDVVDAAEFPLALVAVTVKS